MSKLTQEQGFFLTLVLFQILCLVFYAVKFESANAKTLTAGGDEGSAAGETVVNPARLQGFYAMYMDVHVMIFVGFGFLMTYLRKYSFSAVTLNFLLSVLAIQWSIICVTYAHQYWHGSYPSALLDVPTLINADFATGAVLISFGAVLGKLTPTQLVWMTFFEVIFYALNEVLLTEWLKVIDAGGSMVIHTFGAFFGLAVALQLGVPSAEKQTHNKSRYTSDIFAMIGTLFLWMYWPSFNAAVVPTEGFRQERAVVNTVLSIAASCAAAFAFTKLLSEAKKFDMVHIQNATLAGGVAMGASCELAITPAAALTIGIIAGIISVIGYRYLQPALEHSIRLSDTAGVLNLHGLPGVLGGVACAIATWWLSDDYYGKTTLVAIYSARSERSAATQGLYQLLATLLTVVIAVISGAVVGLFLRSKRFRQQRRLYEDSEWFQMPEIIHEYRVVPKLLEDLSDEVKQTAHLLTHAENYGSYKA